MTLIVLPANPMQMPNLTATVYRTLAYTASAVAVLAVAVPAFAQSVPKLLTMGTATDYPPFEYRASDSGEIIGFDVALAKYISQRLGYNLKLQDLAFVKVIPALQAGKLDFAAAAITPTPERRQKVDFSEAYFESRNTIAARQGANLKTLADLSDRRVGVQDGSIQEEQMQKLAATAQELRVVRFKRLPDLISAIKAKKVDAAIIEDTVVATYIADHPELEFNVISNQEPVTFAIAFPKGSPLVDDFNRIIQEMKDSGELDRLVRQWFNR
ncbi:MAG: transporter substrate-binding domain-containing protein [Aphanocapsa sp. GSE-SYN-MK-11-07L]|jgi:polar amino acid transport system substrate-binding protein|nr:transporter substrate-binding domain-containing protein [Aphanocapsa sp. GSE-SYN-MK-11-07L]